MALRGMEVQAHLCPRQAHVVGPVTQSLQDPAFFFRKLRVGARFSSLGGLCGSSGPCVQSSLGMTGHIETNFNHPEYFTQPHPRSPLPQPTFAINTSTLLRTRPKLYFKNQQNPVQSESLVLPTTAAESTTRVCE